MTHSLYMLTNRGMAGETYHVGLWGGKDDPSETA
jgi:hypothetical protein